MRQIGGGGQAQAFHTVTLSEFGGSFTDNDGNLISDVSQNSDGSIAITMAGSKVVASTTLPDPGDSGFFWSTYPIVKSSNSLWNDDTTGAFSAIVDFPSGFPAAEDWICCLGLINASSPAAAKGVLTYIQRLTAGNPSVRQANLSGGTVANINNGSTAANGVALWTAFWKAKQGSIGTSAICNVREVCLLLSDGGRTTSIVGTSQQRTGVGTGQMYLLFGGGRMNSGNANSLQVNPRIRLVPPFCF